MITCLFGQASYLHSQKKMKSDVFKYRTDFFLFTNRKIIYLDQYEEFKSSLV